MTEPMTEPRDDEPTEAVEAEPASLRTRWRAAWRHIRALLVLLHLIAICVLTTPDLGDTLSRSAWKQPAVQRELAPWAKRFGQTPQELEDTLWSLATSWREWRARIVRPIQPYSDYFGVRQRWRMFASPNRVPARYEIDIQQGTAWRPIYRSRSDQYTWRRSLFDHDRMRTTMYRATWPNLQWRYKLLCDWVARQVERDFPDARAVRVRRYRYATPHPDSSERPINGRHEGEFVHRYEGRQ